MQALTFDFHNTLANCDPWFQLEVRDLPWAVMERLSLTSGFDRASIEDAYRSLRLSVIQSGIELDATTSVEIIFDPLGLQVSTPELESVISEIMKEATAEMVPVPGAADTVRQLHDAGVKLGVVSSAVHHQTLLWILAEMDVLDCFGTVVTSASSGFYKSTPRIYAAAMAELQALPNRSVHVGDSLRWDVETATRAGLHTVWLQTPRKEVFSTSQPDVTPCLTLMTLEGSAPSLLNLLAKVETQ